MLERFLKITEKLTEIRQEEKCDLNVNGSRAFENKVVRHSKQLFAH